MTPIADMVARMFQLGATAELIVLAIRTAEAQRDESVTRRDGRHAPSRSKEADRAARYRENLKNQKALAKANDVANVASEGVTVERDASRRSVTECRELSSSLSTSVASLGSKKRSSEPRARGTRITEDWQPTDATREFVCSLGVEDFRDEFVDFWIAVPGSRGLKLDWDKTYKNRAREIAGRNRGRFNGAVAPRPGSKDDTRERTVNALRCLDPFANTDEPKRSEGTGPPVSGLLPFVKPARS